ncbi:MAG: hypothetical protein UT02_C0005G0028, partial [Parcubacteria group bacterium GW2011_GWC2_38_7]
AEVLPRALRTRDRQCGDFRSRRADLHRRSGHHRARARADQDRVHAHHVTPPRPAEGEDVDLPRLLGQGRCVLEPQPGIGSPCRSLGDQPQRARDPALACAGDYQPQEASPQEGRRDKRAQRFGGSVLLSTFGRVSAHHASREIPLNVAEVLRRWNVQSSLNLQQVGGLF